ncbi:MAG: HAD family hydrolase [Candidatus Woesearchaeota archaeon]
MKQNLVFDLWYTLIYLDDGWKTFNLLKEDFGITRDMWFNTVKQLFLCKNYDDETSFLKEFSRDTGINLDINKYAQIMKLQKDYDLTHIKLYPDTLNILERAKQEGYCLGIISNQCTFYEQWFHNSILSKYFDITIFSNNVGFRKPDKRIYEIYAQAANANLSECIMVGDSLDQDFNVPLSLGMLAIHLDRTGKRPGSIKVLDELFDNI